MGDMPLYATLSPDELAAHWASGAPAIVPWGALEWHGPHLPLGLDGIVAEHFASRLNGVVLPGVWLPMTTLPHPSSLQVRTETFRAVLDDTLASLVAAGARTVCIVTGHYAQGHLWELYDGALRAMAREEVRVLAASTLEPLGNDTLLDHAAEIETAMLLAIAPELVQLRGLPVVHPVKEYAVLGESPHDATTEQGRELLDRAQAAWSEWISEATPDSLCAHYERRKATLQAYRDAYYRGSWEEAITAWWATK